MGEPPPPSDKQLGYHNPALMADGQQMTNITLKTNILGKALVWNIQHSLFSINSLCTILLHHLKIQ